MIIEPLAKTQPCIAFPPSLYSRGWQGCPLHVPLHATQDTGWAVRLLHQIAMQSKSDSRHMNGVTCVARTQHTLTHISKPTTTCGTPWD